MEVNAGQEGRLCGVSMYPAQGDEIVLVLYEEELLLIFCVTIIWSTTLLWYDDVGHSKRISGQFATQDATSFYSSACVGLGQPQKAPAQLSGNSQLPKGIHHCIVVPWADQRPGLE